MRILFVNKWMGSFGGVEQNIAVTVDGLTKRGHECHLAFGQVTDKDPEGYRQRFASVTPCTDLGAQSGSSLLKMVQGLLPDVVYFHKADPLPDLEPLRNHRVRLVRMIHDHDVCCPRQHKYFFHNGRICHHPAGWRCWLDLAWLKPQPGSLFKVGIRPLWAHHRELVRNRSLDQLLVGSQFMADELTMNGFPPERVAIVAPVVPEAQLEPSPVPLDGSLLYVGQLIRGKGVDLLLRALATLPNPPRLQIVGDGNARPELEALAAELGLSESVLFSGWLAPDSLGAIYRSARAVVVPSRWAEPFGMIGLEAMRQGRPVVAFGVGGIPDWLEDGVTGLLAPEADSAQLGRHIQRLFTEDDLAQRLGAAGLERAQKQFGFEAYLDQIEKYLFGKEVLR